jgi:ornithine cyclodeaminase
MLLLGQDEIRACFSMGEAIDAVGEAFSLASEKCAHVPQRTVLARPELDATLLVMPSYVPAGGRERADAAMGVKVLGVYPDNRRRGLPTTTAVMVVVDPGTGLVDALVDGTYLTRLRTGAAAGAATRLLARPNARVGALLGTGGLALCQLEALLCARELEEVRLFSPHPEHVRELARLARKELDLSRTTLVPCDSAQVCVEGADVITCATTSHEPVMEASWVKPGAHVNGVGSYTPNMRELPETLIARAELISVDSTDAVMAEDGTLIDAITDGLVRRDDLVELGTLWNSANGGIDCLRGTPVLLSDATSVFKTVGIAVQDSVCAAQIVRAARERGVGREVEL